MNRWMQIASMIFKRDFNSFGDGKRDEEMFKIQSSNRIVNGFKKKFSTKKA